MSEAAAQQFTGKASGEVPALMLIEFTRQRHLQFGINPTIDSLVGIGSYPEGEGITLRELWQVAGFQQGELPVLLLLVQERLYPGGGRRCGACRPKADVDDSQVCTPDLGNDTPKCSGHIDSLAPWAT